MNIKEKYKGHKTIVLFKEKGITAKWTGSWKEIRLFSFDGSVLLTIPEHGRWIQLGSTINSVKKLAIIDKLAKKALKEVFGRSDI